MTLYDLIEVPELQKFEKSNEPIMGQTQGCEKNCELKGKKLISLMEYLLKILMAVEKSMVIELLSCSLFERRL